jgi:hypothetical protein
MDDCNKKTVPAVLNLSTRLVIESLIEEGYGPSDVFSEEAIIRWCCDTLYPDEVFPESMLAKWAYDNGYKKVLQ